MESSIPPFFPNLFISGPGANQGGAGAAVHTHPAGHLDPAPGLRQPSATPALAALCRQLNESPTQVPTLCKLQKIGFAGNPFRRTLNNLNKGPAEQLKGKRENPLERQIWS
jgi:hypothetical protein